LLHRYVDRPSTRGAPRALLPAAAGFVLTALALALPFHLAEGSRWLEAGFLYNAASHPLGNQGSWYSANTWMIVQMLTGRQEASALLLGMSWHMWGTLLFLALAVPAGVGWWRRWRLDPRGWGVLLGLLVVIGFYSMTRMVERYLLFAVPFVVVNAQCIGGRMWRWANVWLTALVALHLSRSAWWEVSLEPLGWAPEATPAALATLACAAGLAGTTWLVLSTLRGPTATTEAIGA
jgi:hypothetical protein